MEIGRSKPAIHSITTRIERSGPRTASGRGPRRVAIEQSLCADRSGRFDPDQALSLWLLGCVTRTLRTPEISAHMASSSSSELDMS